MFDVGYSELLVIAVVALVVIGPKDLPKVMRTVGNWVGRARGMARHFRSGVDAMIREAELEEMEKKWKAENERIMREFPTADATGPAASLPEPSAPSLPEPPASPAPSEGEMPAPRAGDDDRPLP
ncbi:Sec-independent protein translocase protein TatB [Allosphingosinicella humi]